MELSSHRIVYHRQGLMYGVRDSNYLHVADVANGLACKCVCEECKTALIARNRGLERIEHFAHSAEYHCENTGERGLLHAAAQLLCHDPRFMLPEFRDAREAYMIERAIEVDKVSVVEATRPEWPELLLNVGKRTLRLVIRPGSRSTRSRELVLLSRIGAIVLILIRPDPEGAIRVSDLQEAIQGDPGVGSRVSILKKWLRCEINPSDAPPGLALVPASFLNGRSDDKPSFTVREVLPKIITCSRCGGERQLARIRGSGMRHCSGCGSEYWGLGT